MVLFVVLHKPSQQQSVTRTQNVIFDHTIDTIIYVMQKLHLFTYYIRYLSFLFWHIILNGYRLKKNNIGFLNIKNLTPVLFITIWSYILFLHPQITNNLKRVVVELCDNGFTHLNRRNLLAIYCLHCNLCIQLSRSYNNVTFMLIILSFYLQIYILYFRIPCYLYYEKNNVIN